MADDEKKNELDEIEYGIEIVEKDGRQIFFNNVAFAKLGSALDVKVELDKVDNTLGLTFTDDKTKMIFTSKYNWPGGMKDTNAAGEPLVPEDVYEQLMAALKDEDLMAKTMRVFHAENKNIARAIKSKYQGMGILPEAKEFSNDSYSKDTKPVDSLIVVYRFEDYKRYNLVFDLPQRATNEVARLTAKVEELHFEIAKLKGVHSTYPLAEYLVGGATESPNDPLVAVRVGPIVFIYGSVAATPSNKVIMVLPEELRPERDINVCVASSKSSSANVEVAIIKANGELASPYYCLDPISYISPLKSNKFYI